MATVKQIIAFIDPSKFAGLIGTDKLPANYRQNGTFLNNGNNLVYIQTDETTCGAYDEAKAKAASIVLVSDSFNFQYVPEVPFKVLWHTGTNEADRVQRLRDISNHYKGDDQMMETEHTIYQKIADLINKKEGVTFEGIYKEIKDFDPEEETLTDDIFNAIYEQKDEDAIEKAVSKRDKHIKEKGKN